jgi:RNA polymerase sigma-70 factor (ECF subfamily)
MKRRQRDFEILVRGYTADLYRFAFWLAKDATQAEDLVQETLLRAWRFMDQLHDQSQVKAWLITTLRREHARTFERKRPTELLDIADVEDTLAGPDSTDAALEHDDLMRKLMILPLHYREALVLQLIFGYSIEEIAKLLETTATTINNWLFRARQQLQAANPSQPQRVESAP